MDYENLESATPGDKAASEEPSNAKVPSVPEPESAPENPAAGGARIVEFVPNGQGLHADSDEPKAKGFLKSFGSKAKQAATAAVGAASLAAEGISSAAESMDSEKIKQHAQNVRAKAGDALDRVQDLAQGKIETTRESVSDSLKERRLANLVFPDEFYNPDYDIPDLIILVDVDQHKDIAENEDAIGKLDIKDGMKVLRLRKEEAPNTGLAFYPAAMPETAYYIDTYAPKRYIEVTGYLDVMKTDMFTELRRVAHQLGAKRCKLEAQETNTRKQTTAQAFSAKGKASMTPIGPASANVDVDHTASQTSRQTKSVLFEQTFEGNAEPMRPQLDRLAHDKEIEFLIDTRCGAETNLAKTYSVAISTSTMVTLSTATAAKIDAAAKGYTLSGKASLKKKVAEEMQSSMVFVVEF